MVAIEERSELKVDSRQGTGIEVERTDIVFQDLPGDRVRIQVTVHNTGERRSAPATMRLESASLGAFVPWQPLARLLVPALEPGESRKLSTEVARPRPAPLGDFDRVPPRRLLTELSTPDQPAPQSDRTIEAMLNLFRRGGRTRSSGQESARGASLAPDLWDLLGRAQPYWAGNINVFVGSRSVERHVARALRVYPGRTNLAMFVVGGPGRRDAYAFQLVGLAPDWNAALCDGTNRRTLVLNSNEGHIEEGQWVESNGGLMCMLAIQPPADCQAGKLEVHVTSRSRQKTAVVEFDLDPSAQGAGCYSL